MGLLDKAMAAAEQAAMKAKETADELQAKRALGQAYGDLGQKTFELIESGEVSAPELEPARGASPCAEGAARSAGGLRAGGRDGRPRSRPQRRRFSHAAARGLHSSIE